MVLGRCDKWCYQNTSEMGQGEKIDVRYLNNFRIRLAGSAKVEKWWKKRRILEAVKNTVFRYNEGVVGRISESSVQEFKIWVCWRCLQFQSVITRGMWSWQWVKFADFWAIFQTFSDFSRKNKKTFRI